MGSEATQDQQVTVRLEPEVVERAEALAGILAKLPEFKAFRMTRTAVLRIAALEGLAMLEQKYSAELAAPKSASKAKKR